jgi:WD40 repeat protein
MFHKLSDYLIFVATIVLYLIIGMMLSAVATTGEMGIVRHFAVSPNGEKIIFVSEAEIRETGPSEVSIMLFDFTMMDVIGLTGEIKEVALSPDEKFIAYVENDAYYGNSLSLLTVDGRELKLHYHQPRQRFSQLKWSTDSKYLSFISDESGYGQRTIVISPQFGVVIDDLATVEWQESKQLPADHTLYQKKPTIRADSSVLWGNNKTIYVQAVDGIWKGNLDGIFIVQWTQLVTTEDIKEPQALSISNTGTHLLYKRGRDIWVLSLEDEAAPVKIGEGARAQFTPDGRHVLFVGVPVHEPSAISPGLGLWMVSLDGSSRRRLTSQISLP